MGKGINGKVQHDWKFLWHMHLQTVQRNTMYISNMAKNLKLLTCFLWEKLL